MDCKFVKEIDLIAYTFNPDRSSIFYLVDRDARLRILQENLLTGMIISHFQLPPKEKKLEVDNYILCYNRKLKVLVLTLSCRLLIFSLKDGLVFVSETHGKNPYYITSIAMSDNAPVLFFSALEQRNVYCVNLEDCLAAGTIGNFTKLKIPKDAEVTNIKCFDNKLVAACSDHVLRIWNTNSFTNLRGMSVDESVGDISAMAFSKDGGKFMAATERGTLYVWDGRTLGSNNTLILSQKLSDRRIMSVCWFHYSGEFQSKRLIVMTADGNVRLFSFTLEKAVVDNKEVFLGRAIELCSIYKVKAELNTYSEVNCHSYSNHVCFSPGRLLYLVDYHPSLYYPVMQQQYSHSFESLVPNNKSEVFWQRELYFLDGLEIKRLKDGVQKKLSLNSVLEYEGLKILRLEARPLTLSTFNKAKFLINYYLGNMTRVLLIYNVNLQQTSDTIEFYKEYQCNMGIFLGPSQLTDPLLFLLNDDRQSVSVLLHCEKQDREDIITKISRPEQKEIYRQQAGELLNINLKIKIQKVYRTALRNGYAVLYRSENLLRFSKNRLDQNQLLDFQVLNQPQLRIDYADIIIDVVWCAAAAEGLAAVVCLDKVHLVNGMLKVLHTVPVEGYVTQGQWQGYTLFITTKVDVQYVTLIDSPVRLFSLQSQQEKTFLAFVMADRMITAGRTNLRKKEKQQTVEFKTRYFNLMEPLVAGYLNYCSFFAAPFEVPIIRKIITSFVPYFKVSERFIALLNRNRLINFSNYFIDLSAKSYSLDVRMETFCQAVGLRNILKMLWPKDSFQQKHFWKENLYRQQKNVLLLLYQYIEAVKNTEQAKQSPQAYLLKLEQRLNLPSQGILRIRDSCNAHIEGKSKQVISTNFGEKSLIQYYRDDINGEVVNMAIEAFQLDSIGQWIGLFSTFVEAKATSKMEEQAKEEFFQEPEGEFTDLIAYYRFDQGKGQTVEDLSDYGNNAVICNLSEQDQDVWKALEDEPLQVEDKWGKKCPPQFSINVGRKHWVQRTKTVNYRPFSRFTIEIWVKIHSPNGIICTFGDNTMLQVVNNRLVVILESKELQLVPMKDELSSEMSVPTLRLNCWQHICLLYQREIGKTNLIISCMHGFETTHHGQFSVPFGKVLRLGSDSFDGEFTEFRLWKNKLSLNEIKDCFRSPLSIVYEKRKKLKMKLKEKKASNPDKKDGFAGITFDSSVLNSGPQERSSTSTFEMPPGLDWGIPM